MFQAHRHTDQPWPIPAAWRCSSVKRPCEVLAGWVMVVLVSPRLAVMLHTCVLSITWKARSRPEAASLARTSKTAPHRPDPTAGAWPARVADATPVQGSTHGPRRVRLQPGRQLQCPGALCLHANGQGFHAFENHPRIERRQIHARTADQGASLSSMTERGPHTAPAMTRPCPSRNLVPE